MGGQIGPTDHLAELIAPEVETPAEGDSRVLLAQAAGTCVARVHRHGLGLAAGGHPHRVLRLLGCLQLFEGRQRQIDLATNFKHLRGADELGGHRRDGGHVGRDVFAHPAVAASGCLHQAPGLVTQAHRHPVDLQLAHIVDLGAVQPARHSIAPGDELVEIHRVVETCHGDAVGDRRERGRKRNRPYLHRGAGRIDQLRMLRLDLLQFAHEQVVVGVGNLGRVE